MPAELDLVELADRHQYPSAAEQAIFGERQFDRLDRRIRDDMATQHEVLRDLLDVLAQDGVSLQATPRLQGWCARLQKRLKP